MVNQNDRFIIPQSVNPPEPDMLADEEAGQGQESKPRWEWVGSPNRPEAKESSDGISDLLRGPDLEAEAEDMRDLTEVDEERDIIDGPLDDLTDVSRADILGDDEEIQEVEQKQPRYRLPPSGKRRDRYTPPTSAGRG